VKTSDVIPVQLGSILYRDPSTNVVYDILNQWKGNACKTVAVSTSTFSEVDGCYFGSSYIDVSANSSWYLCMNVVEAVTYQVNHSASGTGIIQGVTASVIISDVSMVVPDEFINETMKVEYMQSFGIQFQSMDTNDLSTSNGNLVRR
jgi:hypothetical protein